MSAQTAVPVVAVPIPDALIESIANKVAVLVAAHVSRRAETPSPWMDFNATCAYLGFTPDRLYKLTAADAIPHHKRPGSQRLLFHRDELDHWVATTFLHFGPAR